MTNLSGIKLNSYYWPKGWALRVKNQTVLKPGLLYQFHLIVVLFQREFNALETRRVADGIALCAEVSQHSIKHIERRTS